MRSYKIYKEQFRPEEINSQDALFRTIFDESPDAIFLLQPDDFLIIDCNAKATQLFQAEDKSELTGRESFNLYDSEPVEFSKNLFIEAVNKGMEHSQELAFRSMKGNVFWGRCSLRKVETNNGKLIVFRVRRVVDYMKTAEMLSTLVKHTSKATGREFFSTLTELLSKTFGVGNALVARIDENNKFAETIHFWSGSHAIDNIKFQLEGNPSMNVLKGYTTYYPNNLSEMFPEDKMVLEFKAESFLGTPIYNAEENVSGLLILMDNKPMDEIPNSRYILSLFAARSGAELERLDSEDLLKQQADDLGKANTVKDKFLKIIAHDLKNPFASIMGVSGILRRKINEYEKPRIQEMVNAIDDSVKQCYSLIENISDWSRWQRNTLKYNPAKVDLFELVRQNVDLFYSNAARKNIQLVCNVYPKTLAFVDSSMISSVIRNLVSNAVKYTEKGGEIIVDAEYGEGFVEVVVQDNGIGIPDDQMEKLYRFETGKGRPGTDCETGTGLGLILCKKFLEKNKGKLFVETRRGEGTSVRFTVPVAER